MDVDTRTTDDVLIVGLTGRMDTGASPALARQLSEKASAGIMNHNKGVIVNLSGVEYISSAGLRVIVNLSKTVDASGRIFALAELQKTVIDVFEMSGLGEIFKIYHTEEEALERFRQ